MAAKKRSTRRNARKPKIHTIEGHQLTEAMYKRYELCLEVRTRPDKDAEWTQRLGLDDFLSKYRPSTKIKGQLGEIYHAASRAILAVGAMQDYPFFTPQPASVRSAGCKLLREMALELYNVSAKLTGIADNVEAEEATKLQDWLVRDERVAQVGRGAEEAR
jgi:hypothetical protein